MTNANRAVCMAALVAAIAMGMGAGSAEAAKRQRTDPGPRLVDSAKRLQVVRAGKAGWDETDAAKVQRGDPGRHPIDAFAIRRAVVDALRRIR
jgi:hypothetical protein